MGQPSASQAIEGRPIVGRPTVGQTFVDQTFVGQLIQSIVLVVACARRRVCLDILFIYYLYIIYPLIHFCTTF